jgi:hypothetical protein
VGDRGRGRAAWGGWHRPEAVRAGGGARSRETGEAGALTGGPWLQLRAAVKFNSKSNSN